MTTNIARGLRMNPTSQQGGTQTIQQSVYLTHDNPCGFNQLVFQPRGSVKISFVHLKNILDQIMNHPDVVEKYTVLREAGTHYIYNRRFQDHLFFLDMIMEWGKTAYSVLPVNELEDYNWRVSVYDYNGSIIWDSLSPSLEIIYKNADNTYGLTYLPLKTDYDIFTAGSTTPLVEDVLNPFVSPTLKNRIPLYGLYKNVAVLNFLDFSNPLCEAVRTSSFIANQGSFAESTMTVASLLNDPANTRVFGFPRYGFSARQNVHNNYKIGYYCTYLHDLLTIEKFPTLIEDVFIRLGLEQKPDIDYIPA